MLDIKPEDKVIIVQILQKYLGSEAQVWVFGSRIKRVYDRIKAVLQLL